jgi:hypothetical protein
MRKDCLRRRLSGTIISMSECSVFFDCYMFQFKRGGGSTIFQLRSSIQLFFLFLKRYPNKAV